MKKQIRYIGIILCLLLVVCGCKDKAPTQSPSEVAKVYLEALKTQNSEEMAKYSLSGSKENFTLTQEEVSALGMDVTSAQTFFSHILNFEYEFDGESIYLAEENATVTLKLKTYDVNTVVSNAVENHKDKFKEISASKEGDDVKQKQISDIIISDFEQAERTIEKSYTMQLKIKDDVWKVKDLDENFYNMLLNIE